MSKPMRHTLLALALLQGACAALRGAATTDACTNDADKAIWDANTDAFEDMMSTCGKNCLGGASCVTSCVEDAQGYSATCASCFGDLAGCTASKCWSKCINSASDACKSCVISGCDPAFATCSGIDVDDIPKATRAAAPPSGTYAGTAKVGPLKVTETVFAHDDGATMDLTLSGAISFSCTDEAYTMDASGGITVTNIDTDGDCLHDELAKNALVFKSASYDAAADSIEIIVTALGVKVDTTLTKAAARLSALVALGDAAPSGTYSGSKTVLGETIDATIVAGADALEIQLGGVISLDCADEAYTYADGAITITNIGADGDCAHDALAENHVTFRSATYDAGADTITVTVKYALLTVAIDLAKATAAPAPRLTLLYQRHAAALSAAPSGTYSGSKAVLGETIDATIVAGADALEIQLSGVISLDCEGEAYTYADGDITITNIGADGDCAHDALAENHVTYKSTTYNADADTITVTVKYTFITVAIELSKQ